MTRPLTPREALAVLAGQGDQRLNPLRSRPHVKPQGASGAVKQQPENFSASPIRGCGNDTCSGACGLHGWGQRDFVSGPVQLGVCPDCGSNGTLGMPCLYCTARAARSAGIDVRFA